MTYYIKAIKNRKTLIVLLVFALLVGLFPVLRQKFQSADAELGDPVLEVGELAILQENSLAQVSSPKNPDPKVAWRINATLTAYSSTPWETDEDPFITAASTPVRDGIVANNLLPFGTKIRIPLLYGDKIFVVEDRMHSRWETNRFDIWFASTRDAKIFGVKAAQIEVLEK